MNGFIFALFGLSLVNHSILINNAVAGDLANHVLLVFHSSRGGAAFRNEVRVSTHFLVYSHN